jgi:hypothetical protein
MFFSRNILEDVYYL